MKVKALDLKGTGSLHVSRLQALVVALPLAWSAVGCGGGSPAGDAAATPVAAPASDPSVSALPRPPAGDAQPAAGATIPLDQALREGKVMARGRFEGNEVVTLEMKRLVPQPLHVVVPPGVLYDGPGRRTDLLGVEEFTVDLLTGGLVKTHSGVCSFVMDQDGTIPDQLAVRVLPPDDPLCRLAATIAERGESDVVVRQLAVWAVTLNPGRRALANYRTMPMEEFLDNPLSARGKPAATKEALQQARAILVAAGISTAGKRMFR